MDLLEKQTKLQTKANEIISKLNLLEFLNKYGEVHIVGSVITGLMTWPDIDIEVTNAELKLDNQLAIAKYLIESMAKQVCLQDYRVDNNPPSRPKGLYLGVKYLYVDGTKWKIDIWLKEEKVAETFIESENLFKKLNNSNKLIILNIKSVICDHPKYKKEIFSTDIYDAVLNNNVTTIEDFTKYLARKNVIL